MDYRDAKSIQAKLQQPCMAYCGKEIHPGEWIDYGPNGWMHRNCDNPKSKLKSKTPEEKAAFEEQETYRRKMRARIEESRRRRP